MKAPPTILFLAGEASGDRYAAAVARVLRSRIPGVRFTGLGGAALEGEGAELLAGLDRLAVMGLVEVVRHLGFFRTLMGRVRALLTSGSVDLVVAVDYPGFNLRAIRHAHDAGVPVLYYIPPKVWAWKPSRARHLAAYAGHVAVIFPFEKEILDAAGVRTTFVGNPLLDEAAHGGGTAGGADSRAWDQSGAGAGAHGSDGVAARAAFCAGLGLDAQRPILALLPGSREGEVSRHLDPFAEAARAIRVERPEVQPVWARASSLPRGRLDGSGFPVADDARLLFRHARAGLVKSGTATLEAALEGMPLAVAYRMNPLTFAVAWRMLRVPHVSLPNLVAGEELVPEFLQGAATPQALAQAVLPLLDEGPARSAQLQGFRRVRGALGTPGAARRVADLAEDLMGAAP